MVDSGDRDALLTPGNRCGAVDLHLNQSVRAQAGAARIREPAHGVGMPGV